ncbi:hypothetical protein [Streptomyces sp. NRRL S-646]|uniref:hypothetical protein n=1 Tax=Streptomyces sp. NRRL S-646 TaxID=1463917 RepID=UPI0004C4E442|nr:hypothetical protein [Streptomyces sp. NRRL S-646]
MSEDETLRARGDYVGATADELRRKTSADRTAGVVSQKALFLRRGKVSLHEDRLVLGDWGEAGDLVLRRADITSVEVRFTELYGRFIGGLLNAGKPLILGTVPAGEVYLLIDRKEFMETTDDRAWAARIEAWLSR